MRFLLGVGALVGVVWLGSACGDAACEAGRQVACPCPGGADGVQVCAADGSAFGVCQCGDSGGGTSVGAGGPGGGSASGGGAAGGGTAACAPAAVEDCYDGPAGTDGVGVCHAGTRICDVEGTWGPCMGQVVPSNEDCQTAADEDCDGNTPACAGPFALTYDGFSAVAGIAVAPSGEIFIAGQFDDTIDFGNGATLSDVGAADTFIAKLGADGSGQWALQAGGPIATCQSALGSLATDSQGNAWIALTCDNNTNAFGTPIVSQGSFDLVLAKISPTGDVLVLQSFGSTGADYMISLTVDASDNVIFTASHPQPIYFGGQDVQSAFALAIVKLDPDGNWLWSRDIVQPANVQTVLTVDPATNGPVLAMTFQGMVDLGDGVLTSQQASLLVARFAEDGSIVKSYASTGAAGVNLITGGRLPNGELVIAGTWGPGVLDLGGGPMVHQTGYEVFIARFDETGQLLDNNVFSANNCTLGTGWFHPQGHVLLSGNGGPYDFGGGVITNTNFIVELDTTGAFLDQITYGTPTALSVSAYALASDGVPLYGGVSYAGPWDFGGQTIAASTQGSAFLVRLP